MFCIFQPSPFVYATFHQHELLRFILLEDSLDPKKTQNRIHFLAQEGEAKLWSQLLRL